MKPLTRVVLLEEKRMLRESLSLIVRGDPALELLGSHSELEEARSACQLDRPDVILVDLDLASGGSIQALQTLKESAPGASLLVITDEGDEKFLSSAESIGAAGLFSKS